MFPDLDCLSPAFETACFKGLVEIRDRLSNKMICLKSLPGRTVIWPAVIRPNWQIANHGGYGRDGFFTPAGLRTYCANGELQDPFPHPHNAYLEWMLDNGILGLLLIMPFYGFVVISSIKLFRKQDGLAVAAGGMALSLVCGELIGSMGAQTFYPRESTVVMWSLIGIMARVLTQVRAGQTEVFSESDDDVGQFAWGH